MRRHEIKVVIVIDVANWDKHRKKNRPALNNR